ncbi:MAG: hypothetical protein HGB35_09000, partial [Geobacteraceae bacterium]|nr:hypothetical protein [Geobacteraceae bacterium]
MTVIVPFDEQAGQSSKVCDHFGSAPFYAIADIEAGMLEIIPNESMHHDHGQCTPASFFSGLGIDVLLCNGIGGGAVAKLQAMGIDVYMAAMAPTLEEALRRFNSSSWSGQLLAFRLSNAGSILTAATTPSYWTGGVPAPEWDAGEQIKAQLPADRLILTMGASGSGTNFAYGNNLSAGQKTALDRDAYSNL